MKSKYHVSEAEWEVLSMLWKHEGVTRQSELLTLFAQEGKGWKRQTLSTFLVRLEEKGLVKREYGKAMPVYSKEEYSALVMRETVDNLYDGKFSNLLASYLHRNKMNQEDLAELRQILDKESKN